MRTEGTRRAGRIKEEEEEQTYRRGNLRLPNIPSDSSLAGAICARRVTSPRPVLLAKNCGIPNIRDFPIFRRPPFVGGSLLRGSCQE